MAIRDIVLVPDPVLREVATPVAEVDGEIRALMDDMLETMYDAPGIGLAAPQIGIKARDRHGLQDDDDKPNLSKWPILKFLNFQKKNLLWKKAAFPSLVIMVKSRAPSR